MVDQLDPSLSEIITSTDIGIIEVDMTSGEVAANQSAQRMVFCSSKSASMIPELNLTRLLDNLEEENIDTFKTLLREVRDSKESISTTIRVQSLDGRAHNLQVNFTHSTANPSKISGSIIDLTHQYALIADRDHALDEGKVLFQQLERQNERSVPTLYSTQRRSRRKRAWFDDCQKADLRDGRINSLPTQQDGRGKVLN